MLLIKEYISTWIVALILLVIGVLCVVTGVQYVDHIPTIEETTTAISYTIGITLIIVGSLGFIIGLVSSLFSRKGFLASVAISGLLLAFGIWTVVEDAAYVFLILIVSFVPYLLLVGGSILLIDATMKLVGSIKNNKMKENKLPVILGYATGAVAIVMGSLFVTDVIKSGVQLILFGIVLAIYAIFMVIGTFIHIPSIIVEKKDKQEEAE